MKPLLIRLAQPSVSKPWPPLFVVGYSAAIMVVWACWAAYFNTAQYGDNIEQFNWAQSLELGYHKHPPLPSWLLAAAIRLFGPSIYWAYGLATLCLLGTLVFTFLIGRRLLDQRLAAAAVVLLCLNYYFSQRVQLYNHNTVLVFGVSATVWLSMRATSPSRYPMIWWGITGLSAALAFLSKYQAVVPLLGLVLTLVLTGQLQAPVNRRGAGLACLVMALVIGPHLFWVLQNNFTTLRYAATAIESPGLVTRLGFLVSFMANQVRFAVPALVVLVGCWYASAPATNRRLSQPVSRHFLIWMLGLVGTGLVVLIVMAVVLGVHLQNHWGVQTLQFGSLWLVYEWDRRRPINLRQLVLASVLMHGASMALYAVDHRQGISNDSIGRMDTQYPARRLARVAINHWAQATSCPLRYVAGSVFDAGLVSLYSGGQLQVFDSQLATPWIPAADLQRRGALYVLDRQAAIPEGVIDIINFDLSGGTLLDQTLNVVRIGILRPASPCDCVSNCAF